jgi:hypothetical protein
MPIRLSPTATKSGVLWDGITNSLDTPPSPASFAIVVGPITQFAATFAFWSPPNGIRGRLAVVVVGDNRIGMVDGRDQTAGVTHPAPVRYDLAVTWTITQTGVVPSRYGRHRCSKNLKQAAKRTHLRSVSLGTLGWRVRGCSFAPDAERRLSFVAAAIAATSTARPPASGNRAARSRWRQPGAAGRAQKPGKSAGCVINVSANGERPRRIRVHPHRHHASFRRQI